MSPAPLLRRNFILFLGIVALLGMVGYGLFEARRLVEGPRITILAPVDGTATSSSIVTVSGIAENISFLTVNDRQVLTDERGHFIERLSPPSGYSVFRVAASDRFGRKTSRVVHITIVTYCPVGNA